MSLLLLDYQFNGNTIGEPTGSQIRFDAAFPYTEVGHLWIRDLTSDGADMTRALLAIPVGSQLVVQDKNASTTFGEFTTTAPAIDLDGYVDLPVTHRDHGDALPNQAVVLLVITPEPITPTPPDTGPVTVADVVAFARIVPGDEQLDLIPGFIAAARQQWERDTDTILGATLAPLPKEAILELAAHYYINRDTVTVGTIVTTTPMGYAEKVRVCRVESLA